VNIKTQCRAVVGATAVAVALMAAPRAGAVVPPTHLSGVVSGTVSPGLTLTPTYQSWTFAGTLSGTTNGSVGTCAVGVMASSTSGETTASGQGGGILSCAGSGIPGGMNYVASFSYQRAGGMMVLSGASPSGSMTGFINLDTGAMQIDSD
jgi:hypothetical protein